MTITLTEPNRIEDRAELAELIREYLKPELRQLVSLSGLRVDLEDLVAATLNNTEAYLPPEGATWLARDAEGRIIAMIFLKMIRKDTAEIKRLYVRPEGRGRGLAQRLVKNAMDRARDLGARQIMIDTGQWMTPAISLYRALGFEEIDRYPESENPIELEPFLVYMRRDLTV